MLATCAFVPLAFSAGPARAPGRAAPVLMSVDTSKVFKRAEFWDDGDATILDIINVLGRFEEASQFGTRTEFAEVKNYRLEDEAQGATLQRYEMAQRMKVVERIALLQNCPKMPFTNAPLAASVGKSVDDFNAMRVSPDAVQLVFDVLSQSKSGLIPPDVINSRRAGLTNSDGSFNEGAFSFALYKARALVIVSWFFFGKGQIVGARSAPARAPPAQCIPCVHRARCSSSHPIVGCTGAIFLCKVLADAAGVTEKLNVPYLDYIVLVAALAAAVFAAYSSQNAIKYIPEAYQDGYVAPSAAPPAAEVAPPAEPAADAQS